MIQDVHLLEKLAHFNRERVPERVVHAKGAGAHGYFEVTKDVSKYTKAKVFNGIGKRTPLFILFSILLMSAGLLKVPHINIMTIIPKRVI